MNSKSAGGVILIVLGIVVLAYSGLSFSTPGRPVEFLGLHIATTERHFIPPVVGALMLAGGLALFFLRPRAA